MSLPRHPNYKPSGTAWLGNVPGHWQICAAKRWVSSKAGGTLIKGECPSEPADGLFPAFSASGQDVWIAEPAYTNPGIVLSAVGARCGKTFKADGAWGVVANTHCLFPLNDSSRDFLWYLTNQEDWWERGGTAQPFIKVSETLARNWAFPPPSEQTAIATFLDHETAKIDALIAEQEKLIALLAEKRQATISHAVTRGLNPDAPMKDSGVAWLGEVPGHWEVGAVKRFFSSLDGRRVPLSAEERSDRKGEFPYYGASGVIDTIDDYSYDEDLVLVSEDGANLLNRSSPIAFIATGKYWVNNHAHILRPVDENLRFWAERIEAIDLSPVVTGSAQPKLTIDALMNLPISTPPTREERAAIGQFIDTETTRLDTLRAESERAITLLKERRAALIAAAVTGQIDVRDAVAEATI